MSANLFATMAVDAPCVVEDDAAGCPVGLLFCTACERSACRKLREGSANTPRRLLLRVYSFCQHPKSLQVPHFVQIRGPKHVARRPCANPAPYLRHVLRQNRGTKILYIGIDIQICYGDQYRYDFRNPVTRSRSQVTRARCMRLGVSIRNF